MITIFDDNTISLKKAQKLVGGYIQMITLENKDQMLIDEEGLIRCKPLNMEASELAQRHIVGNVVLLVGKARWI